MVGGLGSLVIEGHLFGMRVQEEFQILAALCCGCMNVPSCDFALAALSGDV